ncbi:MAG: hypothetical protein ACI94Y_000206 [Maribacter sp.]|jgi:hypothetical protein
MRPFKMFFGLAIGIIFFVFIARVVFVAFIVAAVMSIIYAIYRRVKDFITYDRYGEHYIKRYHHQPRLSRSINNGVEPLFYENVSNPMTRVKNIQFIEAI